MDYNLIKPFLVVFRTCSYTKAAAELDVSQPAISQSIKRLEQQLDKALFVRQGRGVQPTSYATQLAHRLSEPFDSIDDAFYQPETFTIYSQEHYVYTLLDIPDIQLIECPVSQTQIFDDLRSQKAELAIDLCPINDPAFISEPIDDRVVIVAASDHPRIQGSITEQQYYQEKHVTVIAKRLGVDIFTLLADNPQPRQVLYSASSPMSQLIMASNSDGLAITTERASSILAKKLGLQLLTPPMALNMTPFSMIYHKRNLHDNQHTMMREKIMAQLKKPI
ncbi:LysR family transcriptional regulator [Vibrio lamellibrachiae]|uniref:LysR family transcriptional regulator n=1 Tax=Vibrio lamellibrachiae TaxID=2910253 RepID=UPI003D104C0B